MKHIECIGFGVCVFDIYLFEIVFRFVCMFKM